MRSRAGTTTHDARVIALTPHPFAYARPHYCDLDRASPEGLREAFAYLAQADLVVWAEEPNAFADFVSAYGPKDVMGSLLAGATKTRKLVFHAGIAYRKASTSYNPRDAQTFEGQLCSPDLLRLANPGARCVWGKPMVTDLEAVDRLWAARRAYGKIVVTHSPSNELKGTAVLRRVMDRVQRTRPNVEYREIGGGFGKSLDHATLMAERDAAVLCLDQYHPGIGGVGMASFEAMSRGTIPLASVNKIGDAAYRQWGFDRGCLPLVPLVFPEQEKANAKQTERALVHLIGKLADQSLEQLEARGRAAAQWTADHLSPAPYAARWLAQVAALAPAARAA